MSNEFFSWISYTSTDCYRVLKIDVNWSHVRYPQILFSVVHIFAMKTYSTRKKLISENRWTLLMDLVDCSENLMKAVMEESAVPIKDILRIKEIQNDLDNLWEGEHMTLMPVVTLDEEEYQNVINFLREERFKKGLNLSGEKLVKINGTESAVPVKRRKLPDGVTWKKPLFAMNSTQEQTSTIID